MAVATVSDNYKGFTFDGEDSKTYGVYISDAGAFDAPERDVEMVEIPGRNGAFALDNGRFQNITVKYDAFISADNEADFVSAVETFRNVLCSRKGYKRLEDEFNTDEYRMAVYKSGLEVTTTGKKTGEFTIEFECKPQRFLTSGETAVNIATSGDTITNPTLFDASPLLEITGYGDIYLNSDKLSVISSLIGEFSIAEFKGKQYSVESGQRTYTKEVTYNSAWMHTGDIVTMKGNTITVYVVKGSTVGDGSLVVSSETATGDSRVIFSNDPITDSEGVISSCGLICHTPRIELTQGAAETISASCSWEIHNSVNPLTTTVTLSEDIVFDGTDTITFTETCTFTNLSIVSTSNSFAELGIPNIVGDSTVTALGEPLYFDLEIGEAYKVENGSAISVNSAVEIPAELPVLSPGSNTVTFDDTVSQLDIVPRWWKV